MSKRKKSIIFCLLFFAVIFFFGGVFAASKNEAVQYNAPIYISQEFKVSRLTSTWLREYNIYGTLKNRTNEDVFISDLVFYVSGHSYKNTYYTYVGESDITIKANSEYYFSNTYYQSGSGTYDSVSVSSCKINGVDYRLEFSKDGVTFGQDLIEKRKLLVGLGIGIGSILFLIVFLIIIEHYYEKKTIQY